MNEGPPEPLTVDRREEAPDVVPDGPVEMLRQDVGDAADGAAAEMAIMADAAAPLPMNYLHVTPEHIARCSGRDLVLYSAQAQRVRDWAAVILFQEALVKMQPGNARAHLFLSIALEQVERYADALAAWECAIALPNFRPDPRDTFRADRLRAKMEGRDLRRSSLLMSGTRPVRPDLPSSYLDVTPQMLELCTVHDLIRYSVQAQKDERWDRVEMFQWEMVKRDPHHLRAHILLVRALIKQGKMEDAQALMGTVEELRMPYDDEKTVRSIMWLRRQLAEVAPARPALEPTPEPSRSSSAPPGGSSIPSARLSPSAPEPVARRISNIDTSRFDNFLASLRREAEDWAFVQGHGEGWRQIPGDEKEFLADAFNEFLKQLARVIPRGPNAAFWGKFGDMNIQIHRGLINLHALDTLIDRAENAASGASVDLGRLEPIRLKTAR